MTLVSLQDLPLLQKRQLEERAAADPDFARERAEALADLQGAEAFWAQNRLDPGYNLVPADAPPVFDYRFTGMSSELTD
jgi:hypothetical protein